MSGADPGQEKERRERVRRKEKEDPTAEFDCIAAVSSPSIQLTLSPALALVLLTYLW